MLGYWGYRDRANTFLEREWTAVVIWMELLRDGESSILLLEWIYSAMGSGWYCAGMWDML